MNNTTFAAKLVQDSHTPATVLTLTRFYGK